MEARELDQIREDIDTIKDATGLEFSTGWSDVLAICGVVCVGAFIFFMSLFQEEFNILWGAALFIPIALAMVVFRIRYRKSTGRSPAKRRELSFAIILTIVLVVTMGVFLWWGLSQGLSCKLLIGIINYMMGSTTLLISLTKYSRLDAIGIAISLMAVGLAYPIYADRWPIGVFVGMMIMVGGSISGLIMTLQLRRQARLNGTA